MEAIWMDGSSGRGALNASPSMASTAKLPPRAILARGRPRGVNSTAGCFFPKIPSTFSAPMKATLRLRIREDIEGEKRDKEIIEQEELVEVRVVMEDALEDVVADLPGQLRRLLAAIEEP